LLGEHSRNESMFYYVRMEELVPENHLLSEPERRVHRLKRNERRTVEKGRLERRTAAPTVESRLKNSAILIYR
jgi:hypothetical protein